MYTGYIVNSLPTIDSDLGVQFTYQLEGEYVAITEDGLYAMVTSASDILLCMATSGYLCMLNQALYPVRGCGLVHVFCTSEG